MATHGKSRTAQVEVYEVEFWDAASNETVERWLTAVGLHAMRRQCKSTGRRKLVDRAEVSNEIWRDAAEE